MNLKDLIDDEGEQESSEDEQEPLELREVDYKDNEDY